MSNNKPTQIRILAVQITPEGILIKAVGLYDEEGNYIRDAKISSELFCSLTNNMLPIEICK